MDKDKFKEAIEKFIGLEYKIYTIVANQQYKKAMGGAVKQGCGFKVKIKSLPLDNAEEERERHAVSDETKKKLSIAAKKRYRTKEHTERARQGLLDYYKRKRGEV
jgi:hypothetical protein